MIEIVIVMLAVTAVDLLLKVLLDRALHTRVIPLGQLGSLRMVSSPLWLTHVSGPLRRAVPWIVWAVTAAIVVSSSASIPVARLFVGLALGGSLGNVLESSWRGRVSDYVCLKFWPAFNFADVALTIGIIGAGVETIAAVLNQVR